MEKDRIFGIVVLMMFLLAIGSFLSSFDITGYVVFGEGSHSDNISLDFETNMSYVWVPAEEGILESLKLNGYFEGDYAAVYLYDKLIYNFSYGNVGLEAVKISNGSGEIDFSFNYGNNPSYDSNNDGATHVGSVIDFSISGEFDFNVDESKLCTKYIVNNLGDEISTSICYGGEECCLFLNLEPQGSNWSENLYLNYGKYGAGYTNTINAQVIYYDVDLSVPYTDIYNSELLRMDADFVQRVYLDEECVDTCSLPSYNEDSYGLEIITDGLLHVDNVSYGVGEGIVSTSNVYPSCNFDIILYTTTLDPKCGSNIVLRLNDSTPGCDGGTCWDGFTFANLSLPENISTLDSLTKNSLDEFGYDGGSWNVECNSTGDYMINVTLNNTCQENLTLNITSWATNPILVSNFSIIPNLTIGQNHTFELIINNTGDDNATNVLGSFNSSDYSAVNISETINPLLIVNKTANITNYTFTALMGGDYNFSTTSITYARSNSVELNPLAIKSSNTFHVNYNPTITLPNVTLVWNVSDNFSFVPFNNTLNLTKGVGYFSDLDTYDNCTTVTWNYTDVSNENISIDLNDCVLNITAQNNWTGNVNVTFYVNDTYNMSDEVNVSIYLSNETSEICNGEDDDGDTLIDEGLEGTTISCGNGGQQSCTNGAWTTCSGVTNTGGGSGGNNNRDTYPDSVTSEDDVVTRGDATIDVFNDRTGATTNNGGSEETQKEQLAPPSESSGSNNEVIIREIANKRYRITRETTISGSRTQITEKITALDIFGLNNVKLNVEFPKDVEDKASDIIKIDEFKIIKEDPIIQFELGNISSLDEVQIQYMLDKRLTKRELDSIITTLELMEGEDNITSLIEETNKYVNLTQNITINYEKNQTEFSIKIDYNETETVIGDVYIYTEIPKCLIEIIKEELIESEYEFEIVNEDPLIVWHFNSLLDVEELNYNIKAIADEDCLNKAKALAVAKKIVQIQFSPKKNNIFLVLSIIPFVLIIMGFFAAFNAEIEHYDPKMQRLITYIKHHFKHGFREYHLRDKLVEEGYKEKNISEALKLNAKNKLHYYVQKFEIGFEEIVLGILILLNILDFFEFLPGTADYMKKAISWTILAFLIYHVSITKLLIGIRKKWVDIVLIFSFFLLIMKNMVGFADAVWLEYAGAETTPLVLDLYAYIIQNNHIFETYCFIAGIILLTLISLYLALNEKVVAPSFLNIVHFHPDQSKNIAKILNRFLITKITLLAFFIIIFNLIMEWLAIAMDALIIVITLAFVFLLLVKHKHKFTAPKLMYEIEETSIRFYEKFINLFHYKKHIMLGVSGLLILHILTELGNFLIPYLTGIHDAIYFGNFYENHIPLFSFVPHTVKSLFALQSAGLGWQLKIFIGLGYIFNIIAALYLVLLPAYLWYHMFKNRNLSLRKIKILKLNEIHIFFSITSISFLLLNSAFMITSIKKIGLIGVDVQTRLLNLSSLNNDILIALGIGILALLVSLKFTDFIKKTVLTTSLLFFIYYIYLFFQNTIIYYLNSIKELFSTQTTITVYLIIFLIINIIFYVSGILSLFIELYLRRALWFEKHSISWIDNFEKHHKFQFIHHFEAHNEFIHGKEEKHLEHYIKKHLEEGEQLTAVKEHLRRHGWPNDIINESSKEVLKQKIVVEKEGIIIEHISVKKLRKIEYYIKKQMIKGKSIKEIKNKLIKKGWSKPLVDKACGNVLKDKIIMHYVKSKVYKSKKLKK